MAEGARRWLVSGRVQGVGFRWSTARKAGQLGITGWAENLPDGRVLVVGRGEPAALDDLERFLRRGPGLAHVENVEKSDIPHEDVDSNGFNTK